MTEFLDEPLDTENTTQRVKELLHDCTVTGIVEYLSSWEEEFISDMEDLVKKGFPLSESQFETLVKIVEEK